jgi:hypothetical protein
MSVDWFAVYETNGSSTSSPSPSPTSSPSPTPSQPGATCATTATSSISADCYAAATLGGATVTTATGDTNPSGVDGNQIAQLSNGASLRYDDVDFGTTGSSQFAARVASGAPGGVSGLVNVVLDNPGNTPIGSFSVGNTGGWSAWHIPANITRTTGSHTVYLEFSSGASRPYVSPHWFTFPTS